jgi:N-acetylmuramoyl-L-alanine amidase
VELADLIEREVVTDISGRGLGLFEADEECYILHNASVPATMVQVGYLSNKREAALLYKDEYRQCIADGIYDGVMKAFEEYLLK